MKANFVIHGNALFDGHSADPFKGFVAVKDKEIMAVGKGNEDWHPLVDPGTQVIDANNQLVMPGFFDSHTHLVLAGMYQQCVNLGDARSEEEAARMVYEYAQTVPEKEWVIGFNWYHVFWDEKILPTKESLDKWIPHRPVLLVNTEAHGGWANSKALDAASITKDTPDPPYGKIYRMESGEPAGFLEEAALGLVGQIAFDLSTEEEKEYIHHYMKGAAQMGITALRDMQPYFGRNLGTLATYHEMEKKGELNVRICAAPDLLGDLDQAAAWRRQYHSDFLWVTHLKQFLDGVSTTHTALMLEDYADGEPGDKGSPLGDLEMLRLAIIDAHGRGFSLCLHSCGDRSARLALDFIEEAISAHGKGKVRHSIEHNEIVDEEDILRYGSLGVIPSVMPEHLAMTQTFAETPFRQVMGEERASRMFAFKSLLTSAGMLAIGSDCPVVHMDPFIEIYRAVTRVHNDGQPSGGWNPKEKLTMAEVLRGYTYGSAYAAGMDHRLGTLEPGKLADLIVLNQNLFDIPEEDIRKTKVNLTMMDGRIIHQL